MQRFLQPIIVAVVAVALAYGLGTMWPPAGENPDPNHAHADFAVWVNGTLLDFSSAQYMSAPPADEPKTSFLTVPSAFAHGDEDDGHTVPGREFLHLHDGNGHVIHRHKPELTLGNFFTSIGFTMTKTCLVLDEFQFLRLDQAWVKDFARTRRLCDDGKFRWTFVVNGEKRAMDPAYVFADGDAILLSYSADDVAWEREWLQMTHDACRYSQTCPWRGEPPKESCISDPTIPCRE